MTISKPLLMPVLIWHVSASLGNARRSVLGRLLIVALAFSWLGDLALMASGDVWFMLGLGFFFVAQAHAFIVMLTYIAGQGLIAIGVLRRLQVP